MIATRATSFSVASRFKPFRSSRGSKANEEAQG